MHAYQKLNFLIFSTVQFVHLNALLYVCIMYAHTTTTYEFRGNYIWREISPVITKRKKKMKEEKPTATSIPASLEAALLKTEKVNVHNSLSLVHISNFIKL